MFLSGPLPYFISSKSLTQWSSGILVDAYFWLLKSDQHKTSWAFEGAQSTSFEDGRHCPASELSSLSCFPKFLSSQAIPGIRPVPSNSRSAAPRPWPPPRRPQPPRLPRPRDQREWSPCGSSIGRWRNCWQWRCKESIRHWTNKWWFPKS